MEVRESSIPLEHCLHCVAEGRGEGVEGERGGLGPSEPGQGGSSGTTIEERNHLPETGEGVCVCVFVTYPVGVRISEVTRCQVNLLPSLHTQTHIPTCTSPLHRKG